MSRRKNLSASELTVALLQKELKRERYRKKYKRTLANTLVTLAAVALLIVVGVLILPVLSITGDSMSPTLGQGELVAALRGAPVERGDIVTFQYGANKILVKRVIACPGDEIMLQEDGTVLLNGEKLEEPYVLHKGGEFDIEMPFVVPESRWFVMGDNRELSLDSRNEQFGCVTREQLIGPVVARLWPIERIELLKTFEIEE